jgi:uncharacterized protein
MSANLVTKLKSFWATLSVAAGRPLWVVFSFLLASALVSSVVIVIPSLKSTAESTIGQFITAVIVYLLVLSLVVLPFYIKQGREQLARLLGIASKPSVSTFIFLPVIAWAVYMVLSVASGLLAVWLLPWVNQNQAQDTGFANLTHPYEYLLAFLAFVILAPIVEELLFRGYLFGRLRRRVGFWVSAIITSITFGFVHFQWNVAIDVAVMSMVICYVRERTGVIWYGMGVHALKNGLAYFLLYIAPLLGLHLIQ